MIELRSVEKGFASGTGVFDLDVSLDAGITGILGRNGSGKTTVMRIIELVPENWTGG